ncbi:MAG: ABC transporter ATP-binding protein [Oscillospiraceae bacterium]|nr:ABC transporter ATP-binding protein [Oscillospiraceae bacterium]
MSVLIETKDLTKKFGEFVANDKINLSIEEGEIRAIIGENGAGKSTLMNMLYGILKPTSGSIFYRGQQVDLNSPRDAIELGIGMVHQNFKLSQSLSIFENIVLGAETLKTYKIGGKEIKGRLIDYKKEKQVIQDLVDEFDFNLDINAKVKDVSVGTKQRVEILKMLYRDVDTLILDEPTAVLIPQEVEDLIERLKSLKAKGKTIIIITHKLNEVKMCADNISVMRHGQLVDTVPNDASTTDEMLAEMMVGRPVLLRVQKSGKPVGDKVVFSVRDLNVADNDGKKILNDISFDIHENEVLGVAGVEGNGQSELMFALSGLMNVESGKVILDGKDITGLWPDELRKEGVGVIPEDRYLQGLCTGDFISNNLVAGYHWKDKFCKNGVMNYKVIKQNFEEQIEEFDIRLSDGDTAVSSLSGGNAQKVIVARELSQNPRVLLICQPTRGVDIGAIEFIHNHILKMRDAGTAVFVISSELSEVTGLSDNLIVMNHGEITGKFKTDSISYKELGLYMSGAKKMSKEEMQRAEGEG